MPSIPADASAGGEPVLELRRAAELQDDLLCAGNDLDRLQALLAGSCDALSTSFFAAHAEIDGLRGAGHEALARRASEPLAQAVAALQFQDMASQLIEHTRQRLRHCADRLAVAAFAGDGQDEAGVVAAAPLRPNPVTQDEMDAGSVELF